MAEVAVAGQVQLAETLQLEEERSQDLAAMEQLHL